MSRTRTALLWLCLLPILALAGCREYKMQGRQIDKKHRIDVEKPDIYNASGEQLSSRQAAYRYEIGVNDVLAISIERHPEFSGNFTVDSDGFITIPLSFELVRAEDKSLRGLEGDIAFSLRKYFKRDPEVHVEVKEVNSKHYIVLGQVGSAKSGLVPMTARELRLTEALLAARVQDNDSADLQKVHVIRPDRYHPTYVSVNAEAVIMGRREDDLIIRPNDIIYIPKRLDKKLDDIIDYLLKRSGQIISMDQNFQYLEDMVPHRDLEDDISGE